MFTHKEYTTIYADTFLSFKKYRIIIVLFFFFLKLFHCHLSILKKYTETLSFLMNKASLQLWESLEVVSIFHYFKTVLLPYASFCIFV